MSDLFSTLTKLFGRLMKETPLTLVVIIILLAGYYVGKVYINKYIKSKPKETIPSFLRFFIYYENPSWSAFKMILHIVEFALLVALILWLCNLVGLKLPAGTI